MFAKLALRNVKRQFSSYIVYFITVVFTVALMFAVNNILFAKELRDLLTFEEDMTWSLGIFIALVTLVVGFIICYATAFLLRKRKKELGTYLLLGIRRSAVMRIFIVENLIVSAASFILGCFAGFGVFKILDVIVRGLIGKDYLPPLAFAPGSIWLTALQWAGIFFAAILYAGIVLGKSKIGNLINAKTVDKKLPRFPKTEKTLAFVMLAVIVTATAAIVWLLLDSWIFNVNENPHLEIETYVVLIGFLVLVLIAAIIAFYFLMRGFYLDRLKSKKAFKGGNVFHYRQMSGSLNRNSLIMGLIAVLMSFTVLFTDTAFSAHYSLVEQLNQQEKFDLVGSWDLGAYAENNLQPVLSPEEVIVYAQEKAGISFMLRYDLYQPDWEGSGFSENDLLYFRYLRVLKQSDYNARMRTQGEPELDVSAGEFYMITDSPKSDWNAPWYEAFGAGVRVTLFGKELTSKGVAISTSDRLIVVSDNLLTGAQWGNYLATTVLCINTKKFLPSDLFKEKLHDYNWGSFMLQDIGADGISIYNKYAELAAHYTQSSISVIAALYLSVAFMFFAMALLSLKVMSDMDLDKKRYAILNMLGVSAGRQRKIMLRQILAFFAAPLLIPIFFMIPAVIFSALICYQALGYVHLGIYGIAAAVPLVYAGIYAAYLGATYYLSVKSSITPLEKPAVKLLTKE